MSRAVICLLAAILLASLLYVPVSVTAGGADKSAEKLVENANRLYTLASCRYDLLEKAGAEGLEDVATLISEAGEALANATAGMEDGNYTSAKYYAITAINLLCSALNSEEELAEENGVSLAGCGLELAAEVRERNATRYPLEVAFNVTEDRMNELLESINRAMARVSSLSESGLISEDLAEEITANLTKLKEILEVNVSGLIEEGRSLLREFNISEAAHRLAEAKRLLGIVNSALHKLGYKMLTVRGRTIGLNLTEAEAKMLLKQRRFENEIRKRLENMREHLLRQLEQFRERVRRMVEKMLEKLDKTPPGLERKLPGDEGLQGSGAKGGNGKDKGKGGKP